MLAEKTRYLVTGPTRDGKHTLSVFRNTSSGKSMRRIYLGDFHTRNGARAYAAIHAGSQPFAISIDVVRG